jgi:hypothetical protein
MKDKYKTKIKQYAVLNSAQRENAVPLIVQFFNSN